MDGSGTDAGPAQDAVDEFTAAGGTAVADGNDLRDRGLRLVTLTAVLALAAVLLTIAQISRRRLPQVVLIGAAVLAWIGSLVTAFSTGLT